MMDDDEQDTHAQALYYGLLPELDKLDFNSQLNLLANWTKYVIYPEAVRVTPDGFDTYPAVLGLCRRFAGSIVDLAEHIDRVAIEEAFREVDGCGTCEACKRHLKRRVEEATEETTGAQAPDGGRN